MTACQEPRCERPVFARGICSRHYRQLRAAGGVTTMRSEADSRPVVDGPIARVPLTKGLVAIIDADDAPRIGRYRWASVWSATSRSYYAGGGGKPSVPMHRFLVDAPAGLDVDHLNHDTLDNRRSNLRLATRVDNNRNRRGVTALNTSGYMGVGFERGTGKYRARVQANGERVSVGFFASAIEAALARDAWIREHCPSEFWTYNFPLLPGERGITQPQGATA